MPSLTPTKLDQIPLSMTTATIQSSNPVHALKADTRKTNGLTGLTSGNADFDQLLDRLHVAFGELARTDDVDSTAATDAADDLSSTYTSITGRSQPMADDKAGALAMSLQQGLAGMPSSLTDRLGQNMLRSL